MAKGLYLPKSWTSDQDRCAVAGTPEARRCYRSKTEGGPGTAGTGRGAGHLKAEQVDGDDAFGMSADLYG